MQRRFAAAHLQRWTSDGVNVRYCLVARFYVLGLALLLAACSGTGGIIGGLVPAPKFLDGKVDKSTYYAPNNAFSVRLPHPPEQSNADQYEWAYTKVHEINDGPIIAIVFGPAAFDRNLYVAALARTPMLPDKDAHVNQAFGNRVQFRTATYGQTYAEKARQRFELHGRPCYYAVYESEKAFLVLSLTDAGSSYYAVEADVAKIGNRVTTLEELINRRWAIFNSMLESFSMSDNAE